MSYKNNCHHTPRGCLSRAVEDVAGGNIWAGKEEEKQRKLFLFSPWNLFRIFPSATCLGLSLDSSELIKPGPKGTNTQNATIVLERLGFAVGRVPRSCG